MEWYQLTPTQVEEKLETNPSAGLTEEEANTRLAKYGPNKLAETKKKSLMEKLIAQLRDPLVLILIAAAILSALTQAGIEALIIVAIV
ncbi:MAG: cation-transporting P-type ATPase, partial [Peptoniphilaceae bacterium]|nr:cation-transporting P-type ATPase [Peptoniphilaceae bacterium]MDY5765784.1 cation-transporting P-type ATPase [Peptoniphilaceae bacterium]